MCLQKVKISFYPLAWGVRLLARWVPFTGSAYECLGPCWYGVSKQDHTLPQVFSYIKLFTRLLLNINKFSHAVLHGVRCRTFPISGLMIPRQLRQIRHLCLYCLLRGHACCVSDC